MCADFRPVAGSRLFARAVERDDLPFVVAAMFTAGVKPEAERLKRSLENFGLNFALYEVPAIHRSISTTGSDDLAFCKPNFIHSLLEECRRPILYVDADVVFRQEPREIVGATRDHVDFAVYNWLADIATDAYVPVDVVLNGVTFKNRFYRFSHSIDLFDPTQLMASGAAQYYGPNARSLLAGWLETISRFPTVADDEALDHAYNFVIEKNLVHAVWLPKEYCRIAWWIHVQPVIDHPQFPARNDPKVSRSFRAVAGHERLKMEGLQTRPPQSPFPRDCLIDAKEKQLLRVNTQGSATVVGRFTGDLWIESRPLRQPSTTSAPQLQPAGLLINRHE